MIQPIESIGKYVNPEDARKIAQVCAWMGCNSLTLGISESQGCYIGVQYTVPEYVGTAENIWARCKRNKKLTKDHLVISIPAYNKSIRLRLETALIAILNPKLNTVKTVYWRAR